MLQAATSFCSVAPLTDHKESLLQSAGTPNATATGLFPLGLSEGSRDGYLYVPPTYVAGTGLPLIVTLHAAQKNGLDGLALLYPFAASAGEWVQQQPDRCFCTASVSAGALHVPDATGRSAQALLHKFVHQPAKSSLLEIRNSIALSGLSCEIHLVGTLQCQQQCREENEMFSLACRQMVLERLPVQALSSTS